MVSIYRSYIVALAIVGLVPACNAEQVAECNAFDVDDSAIKAPVSNPPDAVPGSAVMSTILGPIALNRAKWGPDTTAPFSWPGRAVQIEEAHPSLPEDQLIYEIRLPEGAELHKVHIWVDPANGHKDIPASRAQAMVWAYNGGMQYQALLSDPMLTPDSSVVAYEQRFLLTSELEDPYIVAADERIFVYVFGEWGANSIPGLAVDTPEIVYEPPN